MTVGGRHRQRQRRAGGDASDTRKQLESANQWIQHEEAERAPTGWERNSSLGNRLTQRPEEGQISSRVGVHHSAHPSTQRLSTAAVRSGEGLDSTV